MSTPAAEFRDVSKVYRVGLFGRDRRPAVTGVNLQINRGEVFGLLGPNRAGKTTLVKLLLSLARPTGGEVRRLGAPATDRSTLARIGYVHENPALPRYLTPAQLLDYFGAMTFLPHELIRRRAPELLERVGLADRAGDRIDTFSKGMVQRLGVAQAVLNDPELLVLDEPGEGLDVLGRRLIAEVVNEYRQAGRTVIVVTHVPRELEAHFDRVGVIVAGRLVFDGPVAGLTGDGKRAMDDTLHDLYTRPVS